MRRYNPPVNMPYQRTEDKTLKQITNVLQHAGTYSAGSDPKEHPKLILKTLKDADPTARDSKRPYQFLGWLLDVFKKDPTRTLEDLYKGKEYLTLVVTAQKGPDNPPWASRPITVKRFPTIMSLGRYLGEIGVRKKKKRATSAWLKKVEELERTGDAQIILDGKWTPGVPKPKTAQKKKGKRVYVAVSRGVIFVDVLSEKAACSLGAETQWCTAQGAYTSYAPSGLIIMYNLHNHSRIQFTADLEEAMDEEDDPISWSSIQYKGWYAAAKKAGKIVQKRLSILKVSTTPISEWLNGKISAKDEKWLLKHYPHLRVPPLRYLHTHRAEVIKFLKAQTYTPALKREFDRLARHTNKQALEVELCVLRHPVAWHMLKPYLAMKDIPGGSHQFQDAKVHLRNFELGKYEVIVGLWLFVVGPQSTNSPPYTNIRLPVTNVSWYDAVEFCNALSHAAELEPAYLLTRTKGKITKVDWLWNSDGFRLPSEAEWEAAARGRGKFVYAGSNNPDEVAWHAANSGGRAHSVGGKKPNQYGLYDMSGNVWEWVYDTYTSDPHDKESHPDFAEE